MTRLRNSINLLSAAAILGAVVASTSAAAEDRLLKEAVNFTGTITFLSAKVPGFILIAVRNGDVAFAGFGDIADKRREDA